MSGVKLTCDETPLAWPASVAVSDLTVCTGCGIKIIAPQPGSLQALTRRQGGGVGDGVNVDEAISVGADYRGQRYSYEESIFHTPGLHVFPGQSAVYPAEYHIHMRTMSAPIRYITLVIPVSHMVQGPGQDYFAAISAHPDPAATRPTLDTILVPGTDMIQYQGPDIRGRNGDTATCDSSQERQFLLVLDVAQIRATDLERIPREGSLSTDPSDLPAPGVRSAQAVPRDRLIKYSVLARPGILGSGGLGSSAPTLPESFSEMKCKPLKVVNGRDVIEEGGKTVDLLSILQPSTDQGDAASTINTTLGVGLIMFFCVSAGLLLSDLFFRKCVWEIFFTGGNLQEWEPIKIFIFFTIAVVTAAFAGNIIGHYNNRNQ